MKIEQSKLKSPAETPASALVKEGNSHETDEDVRDIFPFLLKVTIPIRSPVRLSCHWKVQPILDLKWIVST